MSNDLAIGQLDNDDMSWTIMQTWNTCLQIVKYGQVGVCIICAFSVIKNVIKYIENRKGNENETH